MSSPLAFSPSIHPSLSPSSRLPPLTAQVAMGKLKWVLAPWAVLLLLQLASASHHTRRSLETEAAAPPASVPASIVSPLLRTGYHFQPPKNWINGKIYTYYSCLNLLSLCSSMSSS